MCLSSACLSVVCLPVFMSVFLSVCLPVYLCTYLSPWLSVRLCLPHPKAWCFQAWHAPEKKQQQHCSTHRACRQVYIACNIIALPALPAPDNKYMCHKAQRSTKDNPTLKNTNNQPAIHYIPQTQQRQKRRAASRSPYSLQEAY